MKFHSKKKQALPHKDVKLVEIYQYHTDSSVHLLRVKYARVEEKKQNKTKQGPILSHAKILLEDRCV